MSRAAVTHPTRRALGRTVFGAALLAACPAIGSAGDAPAPAARQGTGLAVARHVIAGGGDTSSGGVFAVSGTIGQPDADPLQPSTGGVFAITGGFWPGVRPAASATDPVFANGFEAGAP